MIGELIRVAHSKLVFDRRTEVLARELGGLIPDDAHVLDVGTGDGRIASLLGHGRPGVHVEGIDVLVREDTHIPVRRFDGNTIPRPDRSVDVVTFVDVLHHTAHPDQLIREASRVAREAVIIKDHLARSKFDRAVLGLMDWVGNAPHGVALPYNYASPDLWRTWFADARLGVETFTTDVPLYPWPFSPVFGRELHFIARLSPVA
jgi:SAM-dependent methyltransferase